MNSPVVVVGAGSRAARFVAQAFADQPVTRVARSALAGAVDFEIDDYRAVPAGAIRPGAVVVNCVGTPDGDDATLDRVNRQIPVAWAAAARAAGARQFVQLSSLSVFGRIGRVGRATPPAPTTGYGRSKLAAERDLAALATPVFAVTSIRTPILVGGGDHADKLARLVRTARWLRLVPRLTPDIRRSMLSYAGLGAAVRLVAEAGQGGIVFAADPEPFGYDLLAQALRDTGVGVARLPSGLLGSTVRRVAPAVHDRLFSSMWIDPNDNLMPEDDYTRLRDVIAAEIRASAART